MALGRLSIILDADIAKFESDLGRAQRIADRQARAMQRSFEAAATRIATVLGSAFAVGKMVQFTKGAIDLADNLNLMSQRVGISAGTLSALKLEADRNGASFDTLKASTNAFARAVGTAAFTATSQQAQAFKALGISVTDANGRIRPTQDILMQAVGKLAGYRDGLAKTILTQQLFGKSGAELIPTLNALGTEGLQKVTEDAKALGVYIGDDAAAAATKFNEQVGNLKSALGGIAITFANELLPTLQASVDKLVEFIKTAREDGSIKKFADALGFVVDHLKEIAEFIVARALLARFGAGLVSVAASASKAGLAVGILRGIIATMGGPITLVATAIAALGVTAYNAFQKQREVVDAAALATEDLRKAQERLTEANNGGLVAQSKITEAARNAAVAHLTAAKAALAQAEAEAAITAKAVRGPIVGGPGAFAGQLGTQFADASARSLVDARKKQVAELEKEINELTGKLGKDPLGEMLPQAGKPEAPTVANPGKSTAKVAKDFTQALIDQRLQVQLTTTQYAVYKATIGGATDAQQEQVRAASDALEAAKKQQQEMQALNGFLEQHKAELNGVSNAEQVFNDTMAMANKALEQGAIRWDQFSRIAQAAIDDLNGHGKAQLEDLSQFGIQAARNMQSAFADFLFDPFKGGIKGMVESFGDALRRMYANLLASQLFNTLKTWSARNAGGGGFWGTIASSMAQMFQSKSALGNVFDPSGLVKFATGGIVNSPTLFKFAQGTGLMGEAGPEAIVPLSRTSNGKLGISAQGMGGGKTTVIIENHSDSQANVQQSSDGQGGDIIRVIVGQAVAEVGKQIGRGGSIGKIIQQTYGINRRGVSVGA